MANGLGRRVLLALFIFVAFVFYEAIGHYSEKREKYASVSGLSPSVMGTSIFYEWSNRLQSGSGKQLKHALLQSTDLGNSKTVAILSPRTVVSEREARLLDSFVQKGGRLILSFHDEASFHYLSLLMKRLGIDSPIEETERFENGAPSIISPGVDQLFFRKEERYAFYSPLIFNTPECSVEKLSCYFYENILVTVSIAPIRGAPVLFQWPHRKTQ